MEVVLLSFFDIIAYIGVKTPGFMAVTPISYV